MTTGQQEPDATFHWFDGTSTTIAPSLVRAAPDLLAAAEDALQKLDPTGLVEAVSGASSGAGLYGSIVRDLRAAVLKARPERAQGEES